MSAVRQGGAGSIPFSFISLDTALRLIHNNSFSVILVLEPSVDDLLGRVFVVCW